MSYDKTWYAPNGGKLCWKNLNADSDHPNPWRPLTIFEGGFPMGQSDMFLNTFTQPVLKGKEIEFEEVGLARNLQKFAVFGFKLGTTHTIFDWMSTIHLNGYKQVAARWAYICTPWIGMTTSYAATFQVLNMMSKEKNQTWMYFVSALPAGGIWGIFKRRFSSGFRMGVFAGLTACLYKGSMDLGFGIGPYTLAWMKPGDIANIPYNDPLRKEAKEVFKRPLEWKNSDTQVWPMRNFDEDYRGYKNVIEPGWKKHVPEEDRNKGPPTNY